MSRKLINFLIIGITFFLVGLYFFFLYFMDLNEVSLSTKDVRKESVFFQVGEEEGAVIRELIITMSRTNPAVLAFKKGKLEGLGIKLRSKVTTFEFLAFVFSDPELAKEMKLLQESSIKYNRFVEGLTPKMLKEFEKEDFFLRVEHFAIHLDIDQIVFAQIINHCLISAKSGDRGAFKPLIDYLIIVKNQ